MDSSTIIVILEHIFKNKGKIINIDSIDAFFDDGVSFPSFISLICNVGKIPDIIKKPANKADKKRNNDMALQFLFKNNEAIQKENPDFENLDDQINLLLLIFKKQCFTLDHKKILDICNSIVQPQQIKLEDEADLLNLSSLIAILHVLTNGKVENKIGQDDDIDDLLTESFEKAKVPLILNSDPLDDQNRFKFYIQIEIIFDLLLNKSKFNQSIQASDSSGTIPLSKVSKSKKKSKIFNFLHKKSDNSDYSSDTAEYYSDDEDEKDNENMQNNALLKTINAIGAKGQLFFDSFESAVKNDSIPKFVMYFFNCTTIENVHISEENTNSKFYSSRLTKEQINNINAVIEFLKTKKEKFRILLFDFEDLKSIKPSTILFYTNFLNCFFIKKQKQEMYQRSVRLLCSHTSKFDDKYNNLLFTKYKIYPCLLHFIKNKNLHFTFNYHKVKFTDEEFQIYFNEAKVPMIINKKLLQFAKKYVSFPVFYQLQFIFDALDKASSSCFIIETMMNAIFVVKNIKIPKYSEITTSIKAKQQSLKYQKEMSSKYLSNNKPELINKNYIKKEKKEINKPKTFYDICNENEEYLTKLKEMIQSDKNKFESNIEMKSFDEFWNQPNQDYKYDNGIICNTKISHKNTDWINEISNIQKNIKKRERKTIGSNKDAIQQSLMFNRRKSGYEPKLYKLFTYNENEKKWEFNSSNFDSFSSEKRINVKDSKTPLILLFNSNEDDLISISSNLINTFYPKLEKDNQDEFFVYSLCDRSLTMLNFIVDFNNAEKASIKPIFLILHVPKSKENHPNIRLIVTQIYSFLSTICDLEVTVLNRKNYLDQIEFIKDILKINKSIELYYKKNTNNNENKLPFSFIYQPPSSEINKETTSPSSPSSSNNSDDDSDDVESSGGSDDDNDNKSKSFVYKCPKFVMLINDSTVQFDSEIDLRLNNSEFLKNLISQINKETFMYFINVNESETYESFLKCMNDEIMKSCCFYEEIEINFNYIDKCNFSDFYMQMITKDDYIECLEQLIYQRLSMIKMENEKENEKRKKEDKKKKEKKKKKNKEENEEEDENDENDEGDENDENDENDEQSKEILLFNKEITKAIPEENLEFIRQCMSIKNLFYHNNCCNETIRKILKENLQTCADSHLSFINQSINQKYYWEYKKMSDMIIAHKNFIKREFMNMIQKLISEDLFADAFEFNFDIVEKQLDRDKDKILKIMQPFIDKINLKSCIKVNDIRNTMQEGTNYAMKETENLREIKVAVQVNKDLKSEIPQDF